MFWRKKSIVDISRDFLDTNGAVQNTDVTVKAAEKLDLTAKTSGNLKNDWFNNLSDLNVACQKGLVERFDATIGAGTVLMPFGGKNQLTPPEAMAAKVPVPEGDTTTATLMSYGYDPAVAKVSPFHSAVYAVVESIAKIVATGGDYKRVRLTFQEYFEHLGSDREKWGKPFAALLGGLLAQVEFGTAAIGGKDSMSGTFKDMNVPPTLVSFAVDVTKSDNIISPEFKEIGTTILRLNAEYDENDLPVFDKLKKNFDRVTSLIEKKDIISASCIGIGGIAAAITKMCIGNSIGANIKGDSLFDRSYGSFVLEIDGDEDKAKKLFDGYDYEILGTTVNKPVITVNGIEIDLYDATQVWFKTLEKVFPTKYFDQYEKKDISLKPYIINEKKSSALNIARPRVVIPVFPGTNCEYDTKKAFEKAGGIAETIVINNLRTSWLKESIDKLADMIRNSQIVMIPGGFSAGDEPEGSGKFIAAVFRNPKIKEAVMDLLKNRDGLMLGICNGFQALIKLGLVPYGEIRDMSSDSPTLTFNTLGRHISCLNSTKIISDKSPWLWNCNVGDIHNIAFSHGEGRFVASESMIKELEQNGQIATQYTDTNGNASYDIKHNPNGSLYAIEGITSPDGRILGKMGHSERIGTNVYKNVPGEKDQRIFESGISYFK